jgi:hypothetical protein
MKATVPLLVIILAFLNSCVVTGQEDNSKVRRNVPVRSFGAIRA